MPALLTGRTLWPAVAPLRLVSKGRSISRLWKKLTFSMATRKLSSTSRSRAALAISISSSGTLTESSRTPSKRSVYSRSASSPLSRTSATMRRATSRTFSERKPPGRRSWETSSPGSASRASSTLTKGDLVLLHGVQEGGDLAVAETVGAAVGDQTSGGGRDLIEYRQVVLAERGTGRRQVHDALGEPDERSELYGAVECDDLRLATYPLEVAARRAGVLGRDVHDLGVSDSLADLGRLLGRSSQDHAAPPGPEILELHDVRLLLLKDVLADDADVRRPVLDVDRHVGRPADDEPCTLGLVGELAAVLPQDVHRQPGPAQSSQGVLEDGPLRHRHPQQVAPRAHRRAPSGVPPSTLPATSSIFTASKRAPGCVGASFAPSPVW